MQDVQFAVTSEPHGSGRRLTIEGELDIATVDTLRGAVEKALAEQPAVLLIDLTPTEFVDSTGCRELMRAAKAGQAVEVPVEVVSPPEGWKVRRVVDYVQLGQLVPVHDALPDPR